MFFKFVKKKEEIYRHDSEEDFIKLLSNAQREHPGDPLAQIKYFENETAKYQLLALARITQMYLNTPKGNVSLSTGQVEYIYAAIIDLIVHTQVNLPEGVYGYSISTLKDVTNYIIKEFEFNEQSSSFRHDLYYSEKEGLFADRLKSLSDAELRKFAGNLVFRALGAIRALNSLLGSNDSDLIKRLVYSISDDIEHIPLYLVKEDIDDLRNSLLNAMKFIDNIDTEVLRVGYPLKTYKDIVQDYKHLFN